jgi:hypothetical protein
VTTNRTGRTARLEGVIEVVILLAVAGMAGAASFTHVHDWTMRYSPAGTGDWFGWANAMVTELIPTAAGLEARRRKHLTGKAGRYPITLIVGAMGLSLTGQFAEATRSIFGWIVAAIPAVGFLALVKLMLSRLNRPTRTTPDDHTTTDNSGATSTNTSEKTSTDRDPEPVTVTPVIQTEPVKVPAHLLPTARFVATNYESATGQPITPEELSVRMSIDHDTATRILATVDPSRAPAPRVNGNPPHVAAIGGAR